MMNKILFPLVAGLLLLCPEPGQAQGNTGPIQLLDHSTQEPIERARYRYSSQNGSTDNSGVITIEYVENDTLFFSHVGYGEWFVTDSQVRDAFKTGRLFREQRLIAKPVTIIAVRPKPGDVEKIGLDFNDRLSHDAGALLNQSAAVSSIRKSGSYGFDPVLRGYKYDQLNVVVDGLLCSAAGCPNRMDPPTSQIPPNMIEQVEIYKGPHSFRYGTGFGGTIVFESNPVRFSGEQDLYGRMSGSFESNGEVYRSEGVVGLRDQTYDLGLFGSFSKGDDYTDGDAVTVPSSFQRASMGGRMGLKLADNQKLTVTATHNNARDTDFPALPMDLRSDKTWLFNAKYERSYQGGDLDNWETGLYASFVDHTMDNLGKDLHPRMLNATTEANTVSYGGRSEGAWVFENGRLYSGIDVRIERAEGERAREFLMGPMAGKTVHDNVWNGGQIAKPGIFGEYYHAFPGFDLIASGRLEYNEARATDLSQDFAAKNPETDANDINPNFSIGGIKHVSDELSLGLWLGRAQRSGSINERYINSFPVGRDPYEMLGNPALKPEINNQIDLTLAYLTGNTSLDIGIFASLLQDYITSEIDPSLKPAMPSSPGVRRYVNIDDAFMTGFEVTWKQRLFAGLKHQASLAWTYGEDRVRNEPLPEIAPLDFRYTLWGSYLDNTLMPLVTLRHVTAQDRVSTAFGETDTPSFTLVDVGVTYKINKSIGVTAGVKNLFDEAYYEHLNRSVKGQSRPIFAPGRNVYLTLFADMM
ncbi:MAG: TonB-dependent receptor [Chlorobium sp.]|nr:TonB-dependent receptor [Chlorobium sp.]MCW8816146.1 TonB-dependent receptor [Chlorobium sp.]MCW8818863.1 TonB-dependent receptor [Ignavibacteriaceae bacterium]